MTRKEINRKLKQLASKIPPEITKIQLIVNDFDPETKKPIEIPIAYEVWTNHYRRIKRLWWRTGSLAELELYFKRFNMTLREEDIYIPVEEINDLTWTH